MYGGKWIGRRVSNYGNVQKRTVRSGDRATVEKKIEKKTDNCSIFVRIKFQGEDSSAIINFKLDAVLWKIDC